MLTSMTEKDKMLAGEDYLAFDPTLIEIRQKVRRLTYEINQLPPEELEKRKALFEQLLGKTGKEFLIEQPFRCDYGTQIEIGENFFANYNCTILDCAKVSFGNDVLLGPNVSIYTAQHPIDAKRRSEGWESAQPVSIGSDVWIGGNVVILPGVKIGNNVVIGAGSVVTKDIPDSVVAVGNPCKVIKSV